MHRWIQNTLTPRRKGYQASCSPVVLSSSIKTHTVCLTLVNIFHRVWKDTLPRCLCEGEIGEQDRFARGQDTGRQHFQSPWCSTCYNVQESVFSFDISLHDEQAWQNSLINRCGSQTEEPSGGGRRSCAIKGGQGVWLPVHKAKLLWQLPLTHLSIISSMAAVQVNAKSLCCETTVWIWLCSLITTDCYSTSVTLKARLYIQFVLFIYLVTEIFY